MPETASLADSNNWREWSPLLLVEGKHDKGVRWGVHATGTLPLIPSSARSGGWIFDESVQQRAQSTGREDLQRLMTRKLAAAVSAGQNRWPVVHVKKEKKKKEKSWLFFRVHKVNHGYVCAYTCVTHAASCKFPLIRFGAFWCKLHATAGVVSECLPPGRQHMFSFVGCNCRCWLSPYHCMHVRPHSCVSTSLLQHTPTCVCLWSYHASAFLFVFGVSLV